MAKQYTDNSAEKLKRGLSRKNVVMMILFVVICAVFILSDFSQRNGMMGGVTGSAANVNGVNISLADFQSETQMIEQYYQQMFGSQMDFSSQRQYLQQQALQSLVRGELVAQAAKKERILATDEDVRLFLLNDVPYLQDKGVFNRDYYTRYLEYTKSTPAQFERKIRKNILDLRTRRIFEAANRPLQFEVEKMKVLKETKMNLQFVQLSQQQFVAKTSPSRAELEESLKSPEFLKKVQEDFDRSKATLNKPEQVKAQHILLTFKDPAGEKAALDKITALRQRVQKEDFAKVAQQTSEDPGSKTRGGDLGFFSREQMAKEFADAAFALKVGEISAPVKSQFGYHLIKLNDRKAPETADFEKAKFDIAKNIQGQTLWDDFVKRIDETARKGDSQLLNDELKKQQVNWAETGFFDLSAEAIPQIPSPTAVAALKEITPENPLLKRVIRDANSITLMKFKEIKVEADPKFDPKQLRETADRTRGNQLQNEWVNEFRKTAKINMNNSLIQQTAE